MDQRRKRAAQGCLAQALETSCRLLHPFMPFITEEVWQQIPKPTGTPGSIMITMYPVADTNLVDEAAEREMQLLQDVTVAIRNLRAEYNVPPSKELEATIYGASEANGKILESHWKLVRALARVGELRIGKTAEPEHGELAAVMGELQVGVKLAGTIDVAAEDARLAKDLVKTEKERQGVQGRLGNASFVERAPADIVEKERARLAELDEKIAKLGRSRERLKLL